MKRIAMGLAALAALTGCDRQGGVERRDEAPAASTEAPLAKAAGDAALQWAPCPVLPAGCEFATLHGDISKPGANVFLRVPAGYAFPPHSHTSAERMMLVSGKLDLRYDGALPVTLTQGTYAYGPAGRPHAATCMAAEPCVLFIAFDKPVDVVPAG